MFTARAPPPTAGQGRKPLPSLLGDPLLPGQSPSRRSAENFTKAQLLPRNRPAGFSPVPAGSGCCRGRRALREDGEAERKQRGRGGAGERAWGLAMGRPGPSRGCFGKFKSRSAPQHRAGTGEQGGKEGTLSRTEESQTSLSFSQHFIGGRFVSISSFHPREKTHHLPPPPPRKKQHYH